MERMDTSWKMEKAHLEKKLETKNAEVRTAVQKELDAALPDAVEQRLRDLPFEMVCAFQDYLSSGHDDSTVTYDRITVEFNNSNRPGGGDGTMNIETGVFTTIT